MIPTDYKGNLRVSHRNIVCLNINCDNYGKIIGRVWDSSCPKCRKPGGYEHMLKCNSNINICDCEMCWRRRYGK